MYKRYLISNNEIIVGFFAQSENLGENLRTYWKSKQKTSGKMSEITRASASTLSDIEWLREDLLTIHLNLLRGS